MADPPTIGADALAAIYRHARETFPDECCGYIVGHGEDAEVVHCQNHQAKLHALDPRTYPRTAAEAYEIAGAELLTLVRSFDGERPATIIYHSHPSGGAYFSSEDTRAALSAGYPVDYLVVDVAGGEVGGAVLFRRQGEGFVEVERY